MTPDGKLTVGSLFAGIGGFDAGFDAAGLSCRWQVEIDRDCNRVLAHHWPDVTRHSDVREVGRHNLEPVDIISFGSPCQDLSVAGKRAGLKGERSGLFHEAIRVVRELSPTLAVWENVPGAFSSNAGRDFAAVLRAFRECGARDIVWRTFNARYFGLAQNRERVFLVADFRGERAAEILLEPACGCRHPPQGRKKRSRVAACPGSRSHCPGISGGEDDANLIVAHALRAEGADASEDGTGRETPLVCVDKYNQTVSGEIAHALGAGSKKHNNAHTPLLFIDAYACRGSSSPNQYPVSEEGVSDALDTTGPGAVAFNWQSGGDVRLGISDQSTTALHAGQTPAVLSWQGGAQQDQVVSPNGVSPTLAHSSNAHQGHHQPKVALSGMLVRRLTPVECCRLQGFPDDHLDLEPPLSDSAKYRMLGNACPVPVVEWLGRRIREALS